MKNLKSTRLLKAASIVAALSASLNPATSFAGSDAYAFKIVGHPTDETVTVDLVNTGTGQPVADAQLYSVRWTAIGIKYMPRQQVQTALTSNGDGTFTAETGGSDRLQLAARVPGTDKPIRGSVDVSH